jgi:hypothetical protein
LNTSGTEGGSRSNTGGAGGSNNSSAGQQAPKPSARTEATTPGESSVEPTGGAEVPDEGAPEPFRFFAPTSIWNTAIPSSAPLDLNSASDMAAFNQEIAIEKTEDGPNIDTSRYSVPIYTVSAEEPTVNVALSGNNVALQRAWSAVPLPADASPAAGTDGHLVVWQPSTDRLWEFWKLAKTTAGWQASWGGAMQDVSSNPGVYGPEAWPGASAHWGGSASSLSLAGGLITIEDLEKGQINHALALAIPNVRAGVSASPAERDDGNTASPLALPEGAHLRLDPTLNLASLHMPRFTRLIAEAAQRYGIVIRSRSANVAFVAEDPTPTGANPYAGAHGFFEGKYPYQLLASFPWSHLQLLSMELHSDS